MSIPTYEECETAVERGDANPLEQFIYENEPAGRHDEAWRDEINSVVTWVRAETLREVFRVVTPMSVLKAFEAHDGDEQMVVVFAKSGVAARRYAANEMGIEFEEVDYCRRVKGFDKYAPGPVPPMALIDAGWWQECWGCGCRIDSDLEDDDRQLAPVERGKQIYCTAECLAATDRLNLEVGAAKNAAIKEMGDRLAAFAPGVTVIREHAFACPNRQGEVEARQVILDFTWPGAKYGGTYRYDDGKAPELTVAAGDLDAWYGFYAKIDPIPVWEGEGGFCSQ